MHFWKRKVKQGVVTPGGGTRVGSTSRGPRRRGRLCKRPGGRRSSVGFGGGGLGVSAAGPGLPRLHTGAPRGSAPSPGQFPLHAGFSGAPRRWLVCVSVGCTQTRVVTGGRWAVRVAVWLWASSRLPGLAPHPGDAAWAGRATCLASVSPSARGDGGADEMTQLGPGPSSAWQA